jgi:peptidyl-prolyl cis-trans isomerase B (cyclophilin B)
MKMIKNIQISGIFVLAFVLTMPLQAQNALHTIMIETSLGKIKCVLYRETPMHADNFIQLAKDGFYDGLLFHRVIRDFMIQTGDPNSRKAKKGEMLGYGDAGYTLPPEFHPALFHKKGALAAARQGDQVNPGRESNGSQFYIVQGKILTGPELKAMETSGSHLPFTPEQIEAYGIMGGTPHLDYAYTVFGQVIDGLEVIDEIASVPTDSRDRPLEDVKIIGITVLNENP